MAVAARGLALQPVPISPSLTGLDLSTMWMKDESEHPETISVASCALRSCRALASASSASGSEESEAGEAGLSEVEGDVPSPSDEGEGGAET